MNYTNLAKIISGLIEKGNHLTLKFVTALIDDIVKMSGNTINKLIDPTVSGGLKVEQMHSVDYARKP
jgi:hypothetical protein